MSGPGAEYERITDTNVAAQRVRTAAGAGFLVVDTETTGVDPHTAELVDIQVYSPALSVPVIFPAACVAALLQPELAHIPLVWQNADYDLIVLYRHGCDLLDRVNYDTELLAHLDDPGAMTFNLGALVDRYIGVSADYKDDFWSKYKSYLDAPEHERYSYGAADVLLTCRVFLEMVKRTKRFGGVCVVQPR